jgi:rhodanese-related sulfurtransferase
MKRTAKALVDDTMARVTTYTVEQAREMHGQPGVQVVDVQDVRELEREGVIPAQVPEPATDTEFVLFGDSGWHSAQTTQVLTEAGVAHTPARKGAG